MHSEGVREDGTVEGMVVETDYRTCQGIAVGGEGENRYVRVFFVDEEGFDVETRIAYDLLIKAGWIAPAEVSPCEGGD